MSPHYDPSLKQNGDDSHPQQPLSNGHSNGITNGYRASTNASPGAYSARPKKQHRNRSKYLVSSPPNSEFDLICVGFGPASLAIAVALHDSLAKASSSSSPPSPPPQPPKVLFLEKQASFAWHAGMLLPGAKMQISFIKDLATLRDPRSEFTFLNYLHTQGRLVDFTNLGTFLPARVEYEDYLRWSASFFDEVVRYEQQVVSIAPEKKTETTSVAATAAAPGADGADEAVRMFTVKAMNVRSGQMESFRGRNVLVAAGGQPSIPKMLAASHSRVIHSSQYANCVSRLLPDGNAPYRIAVMGAGQSAAEIFHNAQRQYPNAQVWLIMRQEFLRPSDDSPFVNSVFNPDYIDAMYPRSSQQRSKLITEARATNYGVVRLELLEALYEHMYDQRRELGADEKTWPHRILGAREVTSVKSQSEDKLVVKVQPAVHGPSNGFSLDEDVSRVSDEEETMVADLVIAATGYRRTAHVDMLHDTWDMLPEETPSATSNTHVQEGVTGWTIHDTRGEKRTMAVGRDYRVKYAPGRVEDGSGVWLQGCCEGTHGLSDTLLSVLATRSGEIVESIFGSRQEDSP